MLRHNAFRVESANAVEVDAGVFEVRFGFLEVRTGKLDLLGARAGFQFREPRLQGREVSFSLTDPRSVFVILHTYDGVPLGDGVSFFDADPGYLAQHFGSDFNLVVRDDVAGGVEHDLLTAQTCCLRSHSEGVDLNQPRLSEAEAPDSESGEGDNADDDPPFRPARRLAAAL